MTLFQRIIYIIRFFYNLPLRIILFIGNLYADLTKLIDKKSHETFWEEILQNRVNSRISKSIKISENQKIKFYVPTKISSFRVKTFFSKEPDTLEWIRKKGGNEKVLYDIGANMGVYSIYYAKMFKSQVFAFEPSFTNLDLLVKNINLNLLTNQVHVIPNPLSKKFIISNLFQKKLSPGLAGVTFNNNFVKKKMALTNKDSTLNQVEYDTLGLSIDNLMDLNIIKKPDLLKIDVDGTEVDIIEGCQNTIKESKRISILIETCAETESSIKKTFTSLGLTKKSQTRQNEIWEK